MNQQSRSPRYPSIPLKEAEDLATMIYRNDGMNMVDREVAVNHMGYSSLNGASASILGSLKQYGITEGAGKGMVRLSSLALDLIEPEDDSARANALEKAAFTPDLFSALKERFSDAVPSESALRAHLLRQEFTQAAVKNIVPAYLQTCEYVASTKEFESCGEPSPDGQESGNSKPDEATAMQSTPALPSPPTPAPTQGSTATYSLGARRMVFDTDEGEAMFTYPDTLSSEAVDDLEEWFKLVTKRLRRSASKREAGASNNNTGWINE